MAHIINITCLMYNTCHAFYLESHIFTCAIMLRYRVKMLASDLTNTHGSHWDWKPGKTVEHFEVRECQGILPKKLENPGNVDTGKYSEKVREINELEK